MPKKPYTLRIGAESVKTYNDLVDEFEANNNARNLRDGTKAFYTTHIRTQRNQIIRLKSMVTDDYPISIYTDRLIVDIVNDMKSRNCKPSSISTHLAFLKTFLGFAVKRGYMKKMPTIIKVKKDKEVGETYNDWELQLMLTKVDMKKSGFIPYRNWVIVCFFLSTGARLSSVVGIKIGDVNIDKKQVKLSHTKNRQGQVLPLTASGAADIFLVDDDIEKQ